jgi:alpha,alpha-trehalase
MGVRYFSAVAAADAGLALKVRSLPRPATRDVTVSIDDHHGLLSLALDRETDGSIRGVPFVVPGGRFNEMYGWDSYFESLGLLTDGRVDLSKAMADNFCYEIAYYGKILNANRTYYLTRSQPPFLTSMMRAVYARLPESDSSHAWLEKVLRSAMKEYYEVWMGGDRLTPTGLSRYYDSGSGPSPEVEPGHYDRVFARFARDRHVDARVFEEEYRSGRRVVPALDGFFRHDRAMRESGHDTSYRLEGVCADLVTVDLNSLLYKIEMDVAEVLDAGFGGSLQAGERVERSSDWRERAEKRKAIMTSLMWDESRGEFFDYNYRTGKKQVYESATNLYPLWAGLATPHQADLLVTRALPLFEMPGGIVASTERSRGPLSPERPQRQWDYPNGWPPHQMLIWEGLRRYGHEGIAARLAYRWLYTIARNAADYNGTIPEKYDVVNRTHEVFAEYGNVGTKFSYLTREGFGWMNASFQVGLTYLDRGLREKLSALVPPEDITWTPKR